MTARLRELAEGWKGGTASHDYEMGRQECADELLSILDAEGDGGAVAWLVHKDYETARAFTQQSNAESFAKQMCVPVIPLYPHPARSGVVSDELWRVVDRMIVDAWKIGGCEKSLDMLAMRKRYHESVAALQGERHE